MYFPTGVEEDWGKNCQLCKEVNQFLESIFFFHKTSNVITAAFRESVAELSLPGPVSVILVNGIRWISHMLKGLTNVLNGLPSHIHCYEKVISMYNYSDSQKGKACYFLKKTERQKILIPRDLHA